jgi:hypothetical protein
MRAWVLSSSADRSRAVERMQATFLLHYQYCLSHLQVYLLQANKDLAFLQRLVEVSELSRPGARDMCLG